MNKNRKRLIKQWQRFTKIHDEKIMVVREPYHIETISGQCLIPKDRENVPYVEEYARKEVARQITDFLISSSMLKIRRNRQGNPNYIIYEGEIKVAYASDSSFFE